MLKRSPLKRGFLKKTPFKKHKITKEEIIQRQEDINKMREFFFHLWNKRPHYCTICGAWLGNEPRSYFFDHLLEKERYQQLKYKEENTAFLCLPCHDLKSRGFFPSSYALLIEKTKKLFGVN